MIFYIKVLNNEIIDHPVTENNLLEAFPNIQLNDPSCNYIKFKKTPMPLIGTYEILEGNQYVLRDDHVEEVWNVREMTEVERSNKQNLVKQQWEINGIPSWIFNETTCTFEPPIPKPEGNWHWSEEDLMWIEFEPDQEEDNDTTTEEPPTVVINPI